jgi:fructan beta-fructosidase
MTSALAPGFHFRPRRHWMNDPNGLVWLDGEYHLFFQHNPGGEQWGDIGWGHAVSTDLLHWEELDMALPATAEGMVFSGSAVVDHANTSGLGNDGVAPMIAVYTLRAEHDGRERQCQCVAWSNDRGRTWHRYPGNPVLDLDSPSFRDPKVFWHASSQRWIMAVALASERQVAFFVSRDLLHWRELSRFGPEGNTAGDWECPDLFPLPDPDDPERVRWLLKVDSTLGAAAGGSGGQYFIGEFDGTRFRPEPHGTDELRYGHLARPLDYGADFYAAMSWSDLPAAQGRRVWLGWMNNWLYANATPGLPERAPQSLPRSLQLCRAGDGYALSQRPVAELTALRGRHWHWNRLDLDGGGSLDVVPPGMTGFEIILQGRAERDAELQLSLVDDTVVSVDLHAGEISLNRSDRQGALPEGMNARHRAPLPSADGTFDLHVVVDGCCVELFAQGGRIVLSDLVFPAVPKTPARLVCAGGNASIDELEAWELRAAD